MARYLAVAHQTSESPEFVTALQRLAEDDPDAQVTLVIPATPATHLMTWTEGEAVAEAEKAGERARMRLDEAGVNLVAVRTGDADPYLATIDALADEEFDAVIVSTFPPGLSRWLGLDVINRLERSIDLPVTHVVAGED